MVCIKVVELLGMPRGGKSTYMRNVLRELTELGVLVKFIPDKIWDAVGEDAIEENEWVLAEIRRLLIEAKRTELDLIVIERGAYACLASIIAHSKNNVKGKSKKQRERIERVCRLSLDLSKHEDFSIYIDISVEESLKRDREAGAVNEGKIINKKFLPILKEAYQDVCKQMPIHRTKLINGEDNIQKNQAKLLKILLDLVPKK